MIYYRGLGWLSLFLFMAPFLIIGFILHRGLGIDVLGPGSSLLLHLIMFLGAVVTFGFGSYVNRTKFEETIYEKTGPVIELHTRHTLFWIPMQYWGVIFFLIYIAFFALRASRTR